MAMTSFFLVFFSIFFLYSFEVTSISVLFSFSLLILVLFFQNENLGKRLAHGYPFLEAEVAYCARNEYCESAVDFIARRSRLAFLDTDAAGRALPRIIQILASEHKWDKARQKLEMQKAKEFLETFKSSKNARFHDGKHIGKYFSPPLA